SLTGFHSDYNVFSGVLSNDGGGTTKNLSAWQSATGQDAHSITSTTAAVFVSTAANNYHLLPNSTALNRGIGTFSGYTTINTDLAGVARPLNGKIDGGAYQYVATISGRVFQDNNTDGTFNNADAGLSGKTVFLDYDNSGAQNGSEPSRPPPPMEP